MRSLALTLSLAMLLQTVGCATDPDPTGGDPDVSADANTPNADIADALGGDPAEPGDATETSSDTTGGDGPDAEEDAATTGEPDPDATADPDADEPVDLDPLEVIGTWDTNFEMTSEITAETWDGSAVISHDNDENWAVVQMPEDAEWNPGTYSRFLWTEPTEGRWFLCIVAYGLETADMAETSTATADASSPLAGGCGDFPWTEMRNPLEVKGDWHTNWDENLTVTTYVWGTMEAVVYHDNVQNWAVTRMSADADWNPGTYSKLVWTEAAANGSFWMCTVAYGLETEAAAKSDTTEVDSADPASGGCGGFSWSHYMPALEITGHWLSEAGAHKIDSTVWGLDVVLAYDNDMNWAIVQLPPTDEDNPGKFMKNVWTEPGDEGLYYCSVADGIDTLEEALAAEDTSDASDPDSDGCGGVAWTKLTPAE